MYDNCSKSAVNSEEDEEDEVERTNQSMDTREFGSAAMGLVDGVSKKLKFEEDTDDIETVVAKT